MYICFLVGKSLKLDWNSFAERISVYFFTSHLGKYVVLKPFIYILYLGFFLFESIGAQIVDELQGLACGCQILRGATFSIQYHGQKQESAPLLFLLLCSKFISHSPLNMGIFSALHRYLLFRLGFGSILSSVPHMLKWCRWSGPLGFVKENSGQRQSVHLTSQCFLIFWNI